MSDWLKFHDSSESDPSYFPTPSNPILRRVSVDPSDNDADWLNLQYLYLKNRYLTQRLQFRKVLLYQQEQLIIDELKREQKQNRGGFFQHPKLPLTPSSGPSVPGIPTQNIESPTHPPKIPVPESPVASCESPMIPTVVPPLQTNSSRSSRKRKATTKQTWICESEGCGIELCSKFSLQRHMENHEGKKPFCCLWCGRNFAQLSTLKRHGQTHTGEKPFPCQMCGRSFGDKVNLNNHMDIEHRS